MGGWIKKEKDLREDIRVQRIATALLKSGCVTQGRYSERAAVTLVLGALDQLWMHADTFARDDDSIELTLDEIDKLTGVEGFGKLLPADWLEVLDSECVKLPGFHGHNGSAAKSSALTAKRVAKHRAKHGNAPALQLQESRNGHTLPDQTRPDQTKTETRPREKEAEVRSRGSRLPAAWTPGESGESYAKELGLDPAAVLPNFTDYWQARPGAGGRKSDWLATWRMWCRREAEKLPKTPKYQRRTADEIEADYKARGLPIE